MKKDIFYLLFISFVFLYACGAPSEQQEETADTQEELPESIQKGMGIGPITSVEIPDSIDQAMAIKGREIIQQECRNCHRNDDRELIGPGFEGITNRRRPEWIMNMITNTEIMLELDPTARELLKLAERRVMPHQAVSKEDARNLLEFYRLNDENRIGTRDEGVNL